VPALVISPYARRGYVDHQTASLDAYVKFIEDDFLGGRGSTRDRRPAGPAARRARAMPQLGDLARDFDFHQKPRAAADPPLDPHPARLKSWPPRSRVTKS
jgi:phospholipase C